MRDERGLTLIEIMVSLLIFSLIMGTVINLYLQGVLSWQREDNLLEIQDNLRIAMDRISRELRQAQRLNPDCSSALLSFVILYPKDNNSFEEWNVRYFLENTVLYREWKGVKNPLASNITGFQLEYAPAEGPLDKKKVVSIKLTGKTQDDKEITLQTKIRVRKI